MKKECFSNVKKSESHPNYCLAKRRVVFTLFLKRNEADFVLHYSSVAYINIAVEMVHKLGTLPRLLDLIIDKQVGLGIFVCGVFV